MEKISYPSDYFDPFGNDPGWSLCDGCGLRFDNSDMTKTSAGDWLCDECLEKQAEEDMK